MKLQSIALYCGSVNGVNPVYGQAVKTFVRGLIKKKMEIITGGGKVGLMGVAARTALADGGRVTGVIPEFFLKEGLGAKDLTKMITVSSMHERKMKMAEMADAYCALPGGIGTMDEIVEMITWRQIGLHSKPCCLLNTNGIFDGFVEWLHKGTKEGFIQERLRNDLIVSDDPQDLIAQLAKYRPIKMSKSGWVKMKNGGN